MDQNFMYNNNSCNNNQSNSIQNPDEFFNFEEQNIFSNNKENLKTKIEDEDFIKSEWQPEDEQQNMFFNQNEFQQQEPFQQDNQQQIPQAMNIIDKPIRRSMKIKKEIAKYNVAKRKMHQEQKMLKLQQQQQQAETQQQIQAEIQNMQHEQSSSNHETVQTSISQASPIIPKQNDDSGPDSFQLEEVKQTQSGNEEGVTKNDKGKQAMQQKIRNRISAQNSRDRKKQYLQTIEKENQELKQNEKDYQTKIELLTKENMSLQKEIEELKLKYIYKGQKQNMLKEKQQQNIEMLEEPQIDHNGQILNNTQHQSKNFNAITLSFFTILTVLMFFNNKGDSTSQALIKNQNQQQQTLPPQDFIECEQENEHCKNIETFNQINAIVKIDQMNQPNNSTDYNIPISSIKQEEDESNQIVKAYPKPNIRKGCQCQQSDLTLLDEDSEQVPIIYCPQLYEFIQNDGKKFSKNIYNGERYIKLLIFQGNIIQFVSYNTENEFKSYMKQNDIKGAQVLLVKIIDTYTYDNGNLQQIANKQNQDQNKVPTQI